MIDITIPLPPSVNNCYVNISGKGRIKSRSYVDWTEHAGWVIKAAKLSKVDGDYAFRMEVPLGADIDNRIKAALDIFVQHELTDDDKYCTSLAVDKRASVPAQTCRIVIRKA